MSILEQQDGNGWSLANGDCVEVARSLPDNSVGLTVTSPPYLALYSYSASDRDMSNAATDDEFMQHFRFLVDELLRVTKPGRIVAIDLMNVPAMKERDGYIGIKDFRGDVIRLFIERGFIFHSEHCCWKDPLIEAVRTKALGLMHKTVERNASMCRAGLPQYILGFRKPGEVDRIVNPSGFTEFFGENPPTTGNLSHERWRRLASPVWDDIDFTETLNVRAAREDADSKHVCPFALGLVRRCIQLWSAAGDVVFDPFSGVGSVGYCALEMGRRFFGSELKGTYYQQALKNLAAAEPNAAGKQIDMFAAPPATISPSDNSDTLNEAAE